MFERQLCLFSGRLQPLMIGHFLMVVKIGAYLCDHILNINIKVFYSTFTNVF